MPDVPNHKSKMIEIFRPGTFVTRDGAEISFTAADIAAIASAYDPALHEAPLVVGHPKHDDPAQGWATRLEFTGGRLLAEVNQVNPVFAQAVRDGAYKHISAAFYPPQSKSNPKPGGYYLRHIGCLGAAPPAVSGLKPVAFVDGEEFIEFGQGGAPLGAAFRSLRDFLIAQFGPEAADQALPSWIVSWAEDDDREPDDDESAPAFSQPSPETQPSPEKGLPMTATATQAELDARLRALDDREAKFKEREIAFSAQERAAARRDNEAFLDDLIAQGKFLPAQKDNSLAFMESLAAADAPIEFAEGDGKVNLSPLDAYKRQLSAQPKMVEFGEIARGQGDVADTIEFSAPPGYAVDPERLALHAKALAFQKANPDTDYATAIAAVGGK